MSDELKPCPFCGNDEVEFQESHVGFSIECFNCDFHVGGDLTSDAVINLWNARHVSAPQISNDTKEPHLRVKELEDKLRELSELVYCSGDSAIGWLIDNQESINDLLDKDK